MELEDSDRGVCGGVQGVAGGGALQQHRVEGWVDQIQANEIDSVKIQPLHTSASRPC